MILADSSVWIAHLKGHESASVARLDALIESPDLLLGDPTKARERLGWAPRSAEDAIVASARSLLNLGIVS